MKIEKTEVYLIRVTEGAEDLIESAARCCYQSKGGGDSGFIPTLIRNGHESPLEHASATFFIKCTRGTANQLVRHRLASFSQESTRFCKYDKISYIVPNELDNDSRIELLNTIGLAEKTYKHLISLGNKPQVAREVLPLCTVTRLYMTANFREWRHIIKLRTGPKVQPEMNFIMKNILNTLTNNSEAVFDDLKSRIS